MQYRASKFNKFWNSVGIVPEIRDVVSEEGSYSKGKDVSNLFFFSNIK